MIDDDRPKPGKKYALLLTLLVHGALLGALFLGVQWKRSQPEVMEVELWSPQPRQATTLPPPPPPAVKPEPKPEPPPPPPPVEAPKKPDIVVKEEKKPPPKKPEPPKPEPKKIETPKAEPKPDFGDALERESRERAAENEQRRIASLAAQADREQQAAAARRGLESYAAKIRGKVRGNIVLPPGIVGNPESAFDVTQLPSGDVLAVRLKRSSGNAALDAAIERAILKSSPLPKPDDPAAYQRVLEIKYKPFDE